MYPAGEPGITTRTLRLATGVAVRVAESGPKDGMPLIMLHGWGASLYMFRHALAALPHKSVRVIAVDLRGYGLSDKPRKRGAYTLDAYCADLDALLDALALPRAALVGHSMAGALVLRYALRRPERVTRLILINPAGLVPVIYPRLLRVTPRALALLLHGRLVPRRLIALILRRLAYGSAARVTERDIDEYWAPTQLQGYVYAAHAALHEFNWHPVSDDEAAALSVPSMVIVGTDDQMIRHPLDRARRLAGSTVHAFAGGHCVHEEFPDDVYGAVWEFIR